MNEADNPVSQEAESNESSATISGLTDSVDISSISGLEDVINLTDNGIPFKNDPKGKSVTASSFCF